MDVRAWAAANEKLDAAKEKLRAMEDAPDTKALARSWSEFLTEVQRSFTRLEIATKTGPSAGWYGRIRRQRKDDELLQYVHKARDADEHGIDLITRTEEETLRITPKHVTPDGETYMYIGSMSMRDGRLEMDETTRSDVNVEFNPARVLLVPVRTRGVTYLPPREHMGKPIADANPIGVGHHVIAYLDAVFAEGRERFDV